MNGREKEEYYNLVPKYIDKILRISYINFGTKINYSKEVDKMEKTLDELLFDKLIQTVRPRHRGVHMMRKMHHPEGFRPEGPGRGCRGLAEGMQGKPEDMKMHRPHHFQRERILGIILEADEKGMSQKEILEQIHVNPSSLSELIDKLKADRYVERIVNPEDKRSTLIVLTEKGKARAYEVKDEHRQRCVRMFAALDEEEKKQLLQLLSKLDLSEKPENE